MWKFLKEVLFNSDGMCIGCGREIMDKPYGFCKDCMIDAPILSGKYCQKCLMPITGPGVVCARCKSSGVNYINELASPYIYDGIMRAVIHKFKFDGKKYIAKPLAYAMYKEYIKKNWKIDYIIAVPLSEKRLKSRGFNQSLLLAQHLSKLVNVEVLEDVLLRIKDTPTQRGLDFSERQNNLKDAFFVKNKKLISGKAILLIDDVLTTGATSKECISVLKSAGVKSVNFMAAARVILEGN